MTLPAMALRQLIACMFLLLGVAVAAGPSFQTSCSHTLDVVTWDCAEQFIEAIRSGRTVKTNPITTECCNQLNCAQEGSCTDLLRGVCLPLKRGGCGWPAVTPVSALGRHHD